jgi:ferric-dicitrate binding protein FerR (iron transport regulator)
MRGSFHRRAIARVLVCALALSPFTSEIARADQDIGNTQVVVNDVRGVIGTQQPAVLRAGIDVFQNEVIRTADKSASRVKFQDNTDLSVGASSEVTLDHFVFDPDPTKSQVALSIAKGVVRFTTGSLPKSAYKISTPTATIGVRGTVLTITVALDGTTVVTVEEGSALITSHGETVTVDAGMTTTIAPGVPPTTPGPTPPAPLPPVGEMDFLLASNNLPPGYAAGHAALTIFGNPLVPAGIVAGLAAITITLVVGGGHNHSTPSTTGSR